jgi:hypothetical protein
MARPVGVSGSIASATDRAVKGKEARQVNLLLKVYYSHIPASQGYFGWGAKVHGGHCRAVTVRAAV